MVGPRQNLKNPPHRPLLALDRLIWIGIGAYGDGFGHIAGCRQFALEKKRCIALGKKLRFEIEPRGKAKKSVGRARVTIGAAMLAAAIRVDRAVEGNVWRIVLGDDRFGMF